VPKRVIARHVAVGLRICSFNAAVSVPKAECAQAIRSARSMTDDRKVIVSWDNARDRLARLRAGLKRWR